MSNKIQIGIAIAALVLTIGIASSSLITTNTFGEDLTQGNQTVIRQQIRLRLLLLKFQEVHQKAVQVHLDLNTNFFLYLFSTRRSGIILNLTFIDTIISNVIKSCNNIIR